MAHRLKTYSLKSATCIFFLIVAATYLAEIVNGHGHDHHGHTHEEPAHFKYSKQANQPNHHGHAHDHHGHAHDHHGHAHDHHGHAHDEPAHFKYSKQANQKQPEHHGHSHNHHEQEEVTKEEVVKRDQLTIVLHACLSTLLISLAPFVILFFIPLNNNGIENQSLLKVLLGFASGSLLGKISELTNFNYRIF